MNSLSEFHSDVGESPKRKSTPTWLRVAGLTGLAAIAGAVRSRRASLITGTIVAVAGAAAFDLALARRSGHRSKATRPVIYGVTINKSPIQVYKFFRDLGRLPQFMDYLDSVTELDRRRSHWVAKVPGTSIAWDAEIIEDRPGELIAWQSIAGSTIETRGRVTFARTPGRDMTDVRVEMQLGLPGTSATDALARLLTRSQIKGDLRRLKAVIETGEVLYSDTSIHLGRHPAQPDPKLDKAP